MPQINYKKERQKLINACQRYITHKENQLAGLIAKSSSTPAFMFYERALGTDKPTPGFMFSWMPCVYADSITELNTVHMRGGSNYYGFLYPPCRAKFEFFDFIDFYDSYESMLLDKFNILVGLLHFIMVNENKVPDFDQKWEEYNLQNNYHFSYLESDQPSVKTYKTLMKLKSLIHFVDTFPEHHSISIFLLKYFNQSHPTLETYCKSIAVQELNDILEDDSLSDQEAINAVALQLKNPTTSMLLEKNHQSETEYGLKLLSVILVAILIGIIPTLCLATKRLYNSGGSSINFFKPLSKNLCEDIEQVTANMSLTNP